MINIEDLIPLLRKGWVAMDKSKHWCWFKTKPTRISFCWVNHNCTYWIASASLSCFDIAPVEDWEKSLRKVG